MFGSSSFFGTPSSTPSLFGTFQPTPGFGTPQSTPAFGTPQSTPAFGTPQSTPAFGTPQSTPAFVTSFFPQQQQQQTPFSLFPQTQQQQQSQFGQSMFNVGFQQPQQQITTQMAPVAPITMSLVDRDLMAIVDAYKEEPGNPKYAFRHLLFSVTDSAARVKPVGVSDIMWAEAMGKLEGMESVDRERLWPQLVQGFKDLSNRLKLQDEVIVSDEERLRTTQSNVKLLQRHFQSDTLPRIQRLKHKEQALQSRLIRVMRIVEALEGKGFRMGLTKNEIDLYEKLSEIFRKVKGPASELPKRVHNLLSITRANANVGVGSTYLPASAIIQEQSLTEMQEVLQHQMEAFSKLANVLKRDSRDLEIMSKGTDMVVDGAGRRTLKM